MVSSLPCSLLHHTIHRSAQTQHQTSGLYSRMHTRLPTRSPHPPSFPSSLVEGTPQAPWCSVHRSHQTASGGGKAVQLGSNVLGHARTDLQHSTAMRGGADNEVSRTGERQTVTWPSCDMNLRLVSAWYKFKRSFAMGAWDVKCTKGGDTLVQSKILSLPSPLILERGSPQTVSKGKGYEVTNTRSFDPVSFPFLFPPPVSEHTCSTPMYVCIHCSQKSQYWLLTIPPARD